MTRDRDKRTPLHHAARVNDEAQVRLLIAQGADVHMQGRAGLAPRHFAAQESAVAAARAVLEAGAAVDITDTYGISPLRLARRIANYDTEQYFADLRENGTEPED